MTLSMFVTPVQHGSAPLELFFSLFGGIIWGNNIHIYLCMKES